MISNSKVNKTELTTLYVIVFIHVLFSESKSIYYE